MAYLDGLETIINVNGFKIVYIVKMKGEIQERGCQIVDKQSE